MTFAGTPTSILLVSGSQKGRAFLCELLDTDRFSPVISCDSAASAREFLDREPFDLVLINSPLTDTSGIPLATEIARNTSCGVVLFIGNNSYDEVSAQMIEHGVLTVSRSSSRQGLMQAIRLGAAFASRVRSLEDRAASLEEKMEEGRLVNRAKLLLIEQLRMSEAAAHRYIEKQAMDQCVKRRVIAENIIRTYSH